MVSAIVFTITLCVAVSHATWNALARKVKGDLSCVFVANVIGTIACTFVLAGYFFIFGLSHVTSDPASLGVSFGLLIASSLAHFSYLYFLAWGYQIGDISIVYPCSRGGGVALTCVLSVVLLGESPEGLQVLGAASVVSGIIASGVFGDAGPFFRLHDVLKSRCGRSHALTSAKAAMFRTAGVSTSGVGDGGGDAGDDVRLVAELEEFPMEPADLASSPAESSPDRTPTHSSSEACPAEKSSEQNLTLQEVAESARVRHLRALKLFAVAALTGLSISCYSLLDGVLSRKIPPPVVMAPLWLLQTIPLGIVCRYREPGRITIAFVEHWKVCSVIGVLSTMGFTSLLIAFAISDSISVVVVLREFAVVIGAIFAWTFFNEKVTIGRVCGLALIASGIILVKMS